MKTARFFRNGPWVLDSETAGGGLGVPRCALTGPDRGARDHREGLADLLRVVGRGQDPLGIDTHRPEDLVEIGAAVGDADAADDVLLGLQHVAHHGGDSPGIVMRQRVLVVAVGDDGGDGSDCDARVLELLGLGEHHRERDCGHVVERRTAARVVVAGVELGRARERGVGIERRRTVQESGVQEDVVRLLGAKQRVDDAVVAIAHRLRVAREPNGGRVVDAERDERHLGDRHVVRMDAETGLDLRAHVGDRGECRDRPGGEIVVVFDQSCGRRGAAAVLGACHGILAFLGFRDCAGRAKRARRCVRIPVRR